MSDENMSLPGRFAVYGTVAGKPAVVARFEDNDVWLTQKQLADLFNTTKQNINQHTMAIYDSGELDRNRTVKKYLTVQTEDLWGSSPMTLAFLAEILSGFGR